MHENSAEACCAFSAVINSAGQSDLSISQKFCGLVITHGEMWSRGHQSCQDTCGMAETVMELSNPLYHIAGCTSCFSKGICFSRPILSLTNEKMDRNQYRMSQCERPVFENSCYRGIDVMIKGLRWVSPYEVMVTWIWVFFFSCLHLFLFSLWQFEKWFSNENTHIMLDKNRMLSVSYFPEA